jgi:hypothetical protein
MSDNNPQIYKNANVFFNLPNNTVWRVVKTNKVYTCIPHCNLCLLDSSKQHSQTDNCVLFINNQNVIKTCFFVGTELFNPHQSKKILRFFNIIPEDTMYQELISYLLLYSKLHKYKREKHTGIVYRQVKSYAYIKYLEPIDFLNIAFKGSVDFKSDVNYMSDLIKFMKQYDDDAFPFLKYDKNYIGFSNGVLHIPTCQFFQNEQFIIVYKFIDIQFTHSFDTPLLDIVLNYQFTPDVTQFIYACLGRMFGIRDDYGFMLYLLGKPGNGISLILDVLSECFNNIGYIDKSFNKFGLSSLYDKDIVVCNDLSQQISNIFPQHTFQTCINQGIISIAVKRTNAFTIKWTVPLIFSGNTLCDYTDNGKISKIMLVANFQNIHQIDPTLKQRIIENELPAFIYKCITSYNKLLHQQQTDIWNLCPPYFLEQQQNLKLDRNPLYKFLYENTIYQENHQILLDDIRTQFYQWLGKSVKTLDTGTFFQVNPLYTVKKINICKSCSNEHKSSCCTSYHRTNKTTRTFILHIAFII